MKSTAFALLAVLAAGGALAEERAAPAPAEKAADKPAAAHHLKSACVEAKPGCAATVTPAFGKDGRLWVAFSVDKTVYVASSRDYGKTFSAPITLATVEGAVVDANGEARPNVAALADGGLLASYTTRPDKVMAGTIFTARSTDGKTFSKPQAVLNEGGQRFEAFAVGPKGRIYAAWLDKTNLMKAKAEGREFVGSGIAFGWSDDGGATFQGKKILMDHACECCRVGAALDRDGLPVFAWRHVFDGNMRDHYAAKLSAGGATISGGRVSQDEWSTNACPHHGPSIAIDASGAWHIVWFAKGKKHNGLYYAKSQDGGKSFSEAEKFGDGEHAPSHPWVLAAKGRLYRAWKEFDGNATAIVTQSSRDNGKSWSAPRAVASSSEASDHPILIERKGVAYLSWLSAKEGYRLLPLPRDDARAAK